VSADDTWTTADEAVRRQENKPMRRFLYSLAAILCCAGAVPGHCLGGGLTATWAGWSAAEYTAACLLSMVVVVAAEM